MYKPNHQAPKSRLKRRTPIYHNRYKVPINKKNPSHVLPDSYPWQYMTYYEQNYYFPKPMQDYFPHPEALH